MSITNPRPLRGRSIAFSVSGLFLLILFSVSSAFGQAGQTLYNGITLPTPWPPLATPTQAYALPSYITNPPAVIPINVGRQLFVDDFLIQQTTLLRTQHQPVKYPGNPVLAPGAFDTGALTIPSSSGAWFDPADQTYKMWFLCGSSLVTCYASSSDGKTWNRPSIPDGVVPGTNEVLPYQAATVWMDLSDPNPAQKFKAFAFDPTQTILLYFYSSDGIHFVGPFPAQYPVPIIGDRTTVFRNPFRNIWVDSIKNYLPLPATANRSSYTSRIRYYAESNNLANWSPTDLSQGFWTGPDDSDPPYVSGGVPPQLYNLDGNGYESLIVGLFSWFHSGPGDDDPNNLPGPDIVELGVGFSRDGYGWVRPTRGSGPSGAFIAATNTPGTWDMGNTQSVGGAFMVVGDELWFYYSGRSGAHDNPNVTGATGLATLRRDGFYSMDAGSTSGTLTTRPVSFSGKYMFVNVKDPQGSLTIDVLNSSGSVLATSQPVTADKTLLPVSWTNGINDLSGFAGQTVKFRFTLTNGELYSFWVSSSTSGASNGYIAAGGPGFSGLTDTVGIAAYPTAVLTPEITPAGGVFGQSVTVSIYDGTAGSTIHYTTDGSQPSAASPVYTSPFQLTQAGTVQAVALANGLSASNVAAVSFTSNTTVPAVSITSPANGANVSGTINFSANASDSTGIANVTLEIDGAATSVLTTPPYSTSIETTTLTNTSHVFTAIATDSLGNQSSTSVTVSVNNQASGIISGLTSYWSFDSAFTSGKILFDQSGNGDDATAYSTTSIPGVSGQALQFDGASSNVQVTSSLATKSFDIASDISFSLWLRTTNSSRNEALLSKVEAGGSAAGYVLRTNPSGTAEILLGGANISSGTGAVFTDVTKINDGNWHHLGVSIKLGTSVTFYVDGALSSTYPVSSVAATPSTPFSVGVSSWPPYGNYFTGAMDDVRVFNRAISASDDSSLAQFVTVRPAAVTLTQGATQQFAAFLAGASYSSVSWSLTPAVGSLNSSGLYTAPATVSAPKTVTVIASPNGGGATNAAYAIVQLSPQAAATFLNTDTTTSGSWQGVYGADGYAVAPSYQNIPSYATFAVQSGIPFTWVGSTSDSRALSIPGGGGRVAAAWYNPGSFSFDINFTDGLQHQLGLYTLDWDSSGRAESIQIFDAASNKLLDTRNAANFANGTYWIWNVTGHVKVLVSVTGGSNAVVSGVFFGGGGSQSIVPASGTPQSAAVSQSFGPFTATVTSSGHAVPNLAVTFTAPSSGASGTFAGNVSSATVFTDSNGIATAPSFTANSTVGSYNVTATASGLSTSANFAFTNVAGAEHNIVAVSGSGQASQVNNTFANTFTATVTDQNGNPVSGAPITFTVPSSGPGGSFSGVAAVTAITDSFGQATSPFFTANGIAGGPYAVAATVEGLTSQANFLLTNLPGPPGAIVTVSGGGQNAQIGTNFASALTARVTDIFGNNISGLTVTFAAPASGASGTFGSSIIATALTNSSGQATSPIFTANTTLGGPYSVTASVAGLSSLATFSLTNIPGTVTVNISTNVNGPTASVDGGTPFTGTQSFTWIQGSPHTIATTSPQSLLPGTQYVFSNWSDAGGISHTVTAPVSTVTYTATFISMVTVNVSTNVNGPTASVDGGTPFTGTQSFNWVQGSQHNIASTSPQSLSGIQYTFSSWSDNGAISHSVTAPTAPVTYTANFISSVLVNVGTNLNGPTVSVDGGTPFTGTQSFTWIQGSQHTIASTSPQSLSGIQYTFSNWSDFGAISHSVTATAPVTYTANFTSSVLVNVSTNVNGPTVSVDGGTPFTGTQSFTWIQGTQHTIASTSPQSLSGTQYTFSNWSDNGAISHTVTATTSATYTATFTTTLNVSAVFIPPADATTSGTWRGVYGTDGFSLANDPSSPSLPAYSSFAVQNAFSYTWAANTTDTRALQAGNGIGRQAATWYATQKFSFDLNFTDGAVHQFALYAVDWDGGGRAETVQIADAASNTVLDTENLSNFGNGVYLAWRIMGHVTITVTGTAGPNVVVSGAFFGGAGNGGGGTETVAVTPKSTSLSNGGTQQMSATVTNGSSQTVTWSITAVNPTGAAQGSISSSGLYSAPATVTTAATVTITATSFDGKATGTASITLTPGSGGGSGGNAATFVKSDATTEGTWIGVYGGDGFQVANVTPASLPAYASVTVGNQANYTWAATTSDPRALETGVGNTRIASTWYSVTSFTLDVNLTDGNTHQIALYGVDWDGEGRTEMIQVADGTTGAPLDSRSLTNFVNGAYMIWNISGHVKFTITKQVGANSVISGIFFAPGTGGTGGGGPETVTVTPASTTLAGGGTQQMSATVTNASTQTVTWSITAVNPSGAAQGSIASTGLYSAPATITTAATVTITATSADGTAAGTASITLTAGSGGGTGTSGTAAAFVKSDTTTEGTWIGVYGGDGQQIANVTPAVLPSYATMTVQNAAAYSWAQSTTDPRALETGSGSNRLPSAFYSNTGFYVDLNLTDGNTHQIAIYAIDWDTSGRTENLQITDAVSGNQLDSKTISGFANGVWMIWNVSGHVHINLSGSAGPNALFSGIFFAPVTGGTGGGTETVTVTPSSTTLAGAGSQQMSASVTNGPNQTVTWSITGVNPSGAAQGSISSSGLYSAPATITTSATVTITATSSDGTATGTATINLTAGGTGTGGTAVTFVKKDTTTQGTWIGVYGSSGDSIANVAPASIPSFASFSVQSQANYTWAGSTSDPRALETGLGTARIASAWYSTSSFYLDLNFTDGNTHQFSIYAVDWDLGGRTEQIQIVDAVSGAILNTQTLSSFTNGAYLVWNISGHVKIVATPQVGANAVINGAFFN